MKKILTVMIFYLLSSVSFAEDVIVHNFSVKPIEVKENGYAKLSFKIDVQNTGSAGNVYIEVAGLDKYGFEVTFTMLEDRINRSESKTLTKTRTFSGDELDRISQWVIKKIDKY